MTNASSVIRTVAPAKAGLVLARSPASIWLRAAPRLAGIGDRFTVSELIGVPGLVISINWTVTGSLSAMVSVEKSAIRPPVVPVAAGLVSAAPAISRPPFTSPSFSAAAAFWRDALRKVTAARRPVVPDVATSRPPTICT